MKYAFFPGCKTAYHLKSYEVSTRAVCKALHIELIDLEFNCCGYPVRHQNETAAIFSAARNMALAGRHGCRIMPICQCCFGQLKHAAYWLARDQKLRGEINALLAGENLCWEPDMHIAHLLSVLRHDIGEAGIRARVKKPLDGLKVAAHYGCHALRPGHVVRFDNPMAPTIFEELLSLTGARPVDWARRLECCGHPLLGKNNRLSLHLMEKKFDSALDSGARIIGTACTHCQIQFDTVRRATAGDGTGHRDITAVLYTQMLGLSFGLEGGELGLTNKVVANMITA
ncbi:MAG: CoB--CoM heterodisulfide reductase iron-sulfur subunit B family protein [Thermodesulfobacteriota bacterium]